MSYADALKDKPDAGEYWNKNPRPDHHVIAELSKLREMIANGRTPPDYLWARCGHLLNLPAPPPLPNPPPQQRSPLPIPGG